MFAPFGAPGRHGLPGGGAQVPVHPLHALLNTVFNPAGAVSGDAVYTQEALDRVISQLMEQNATGSAPGPASAEAIASLPKVPVTTDMLGDNGKAECSICMDEVQVGETVVKLPCSHWFHGQCIEAWLGEHDTCPHCRKGIMQMKEEQGQGARSSGSTSSGSGNPSSSRTGGSSSSNTWTNEQELPPIPGAWDGASGPASPRGEASGAPASGAGTRNSPFVIRDGSPRLERRRPSQMSESGRSGRRSSDGGGGGGGGGIGDRVRSFFGRDGGR